MAVIGGLISRLKAEKALKESEEKFRNIVESSPMGIFMLQQDSNGHIIIGDYNTAADNILGIDTSRLIGIRVEQAFPSTVGTGLLENLKNVMNTGKSWHANKV